jgi:predicted metal-dependent phosphoesterase TrpH
MKIVDKLNLLGIDIEYGDVLERADLSSVGRPHVASVLVERGYVDSTSEAFYRFLGDNGPAYVSKQKLSPAESIAMILDAGGVPVLAHPGVLQQYLIPELVSLGLMGLEVFHSYHTVQVSDYYCHVAKRYKLLITGGSDFHDRVKDRTVMGSVRLPYEHVEALKEGRRYISQKLEAASD